MTAAPDYLGTLRGALSDWLYDPRYTTAPYEAQAAHANAIEAALTECKREGFGEVADDLSRGHGWEDTAACWVWRLPRWGDKTSTISDRFTIPSFRDVTFADELQGKWSRWDYKLIIDWWPSDWSRPKPDRWTIVHVIHQEEMSLKSPEGLALLDTARPKVTP